MKYVIKDKNSTDYYFDLALDTWLDDEGQEFNDNYIIWIDSDINAHQFDSVYEAEKAIKNILFYIDYLDREDFEIVEVY